MCILLLLILCDLLTFAALIVDFRGLGEYSRLLTLAESPNSGPQISIEVIGSSIETLYFIILPLTYNEYEAMFPDVDLKDIFSTVPPSNPAGGKHLSVHDNVMLFNQVYNKCCIQILISTGHLWLFKDQAPSPSLGL